TRASTLEVGASHCRAPHGSIYTIPRKDPFACGSSRQRVGSHERSTAAREGGPSLTSAGSSRITASPSSWGVRQERDQAHEESASRTAAPKPGTSPRTRATDTLTTGTSSRRGSMHLLFPRCSKPE